MCLSLTNSLYWSAEICEHIASPIPIRLQPASIWARAKSLAVIVTLSIRSFTRSACITVLRRVSLTPARSQASARGPSIQPPTSILLPKFLLYSDAPLIRSRVLGFLYKSGRLRAFASSRVLTTCSLH